MPRRSGRTGKAAVLMLFVLLLVLGAFALLVTALVTDTTSWAWGSVATSLLAGALLATDWLVRRKAAEPSAPAAEPDDAAVTKAAATEAAATEAAERPVEPERASEAAERGATVGDRPPGKPESDTVTVAAPQTTPAEPEQQSAQRTALATRRAEPVNLDPDVEPDEEDTDAADVIAVSDLTDEVVVIDERPRYHLARCEWLADRQTIPLPVREARELGFTPCAICTPDSKLAAKHRMARR